MTVPRVVIVDNDAQVGLDLKEILELEGFAVEVVSGSGGRLVRMARRIARRVRPHVAIIDLRLANEFDTADTTGLRLLAPMRSARFILFSAYLSFDLTRELSRLGMVSWISKGEHPDKLLEEIYRVTQEDGLTPRPCKLTGCEREEVVRALLGEDTTAPPDIVNVVLQRLFPNAYRIELAPLSADDESVPAVSRSHSVVWKAAVNNLEPVVVKLAPAKQIRTEHANYQKVNGRLVGQFHAKIEGTAEFWDLGAIAYSFMGSSVDSLPSFQAFYYSEEEPENVLKPLRHLFQEVWGPLYGEARPCRSCTTLFQRYDRALHIQKHLKKLDACQGTLSAAGLPNPLIDPVRWLLDHRDKSFLHDARLAITHGDLHAQNMFVDDEHAWTIDFERTGSGHVLRDFVELETDIATRLASFSDDDPLPYFRFALSLAALSEPAEPSCPDLGAGPDAQKELGIIGGIRKLAYEATGYQDAREYLWGLLLNAIFIGSLVEERSSQRRRAVTLAAVLCERLQRWHQKWPPAEWLPLLQGDSPQDSGHAATPPKRPQPRSQA